MKKLRTAVILCAPLAPLWIEPVQATPVEWDYIATGCSGGCLSGQSYPVKLATLTLSGPNSSGTAKYESSPSHAPVYTGDGFTLNWNGDYRPFDQNFQRFAFTPCEPGFVCNFDISWSETNQQLTALSIYVRGLNPTQGEDPVIGDVSGFYDTFSSSLNGTEVASISPNVPFIGRSDFIYFGEGGLFRGCEGSPCQISGFWIDPATDVPEPGMIALASTWLACLLFICLRRSHSGSTGDSFAAL